MAKPTREEQIRLDAKELQELGYAQQLFREMGGFSNFAVSFSIISILTGSVLLYGYGLKFAGPVINTVGWPIASLLTLAVAASMAELASAYPTAGGLYFWAFRLGGRTWAWITGWLNMIGQVTATAAINVAAATYLIGAATRIFGLSEKMAIPLFGSITEWYFQIFVMALIMIPQVLINIYGVKATAKLNDFSVWWHIVGVALIVGLLTVFGKHHNSLSFLLQGVTSVNPLEASSAEIAGKSIPAIAVGDWKMASPLFALIPGLQDLYRSAPFMLVFVLGLLQAQWTYTGYDASAHFAEETVSARLGSAWGVFLSVAISAVVGYVMLLTLTWCIPAGDVGKTASDTYPVLYIVTNNLTAFMANLIAVMIGGAMWLCGNSSISSMSRMWYAFARDNGMPGARLLQQVHPTKKTPAAAILVTSALTIVICLYGAGFTIITSISTIALYLAYVIPIALNRRNKRRNVGEHTSSINAPWNMGKFGGAINLVAIVWVVLMCIVFSAPPNELVLWTLVGVGAALFVYWHLVAKRTFRGPNAGDEVAVREMAQG